MLTGSHGGDAVPHVDIPRLIRLIEAGRLSFEGLITHEFPLDEINAALDMVRSGTAGRVLLRIGGAEQCGGSFAAAIARGVENELQQSCAAERRR